jgi:RNA polymerase sigma factor (sigma-70 family)
VRATDSTGALDAVFRIEFPKVVAALTRSVGDIGVAEELAQDAIVDALRQWPRDGMPKNPGAWLMTVAQRKAIDRFRRSRTLAAKYAQLEGGPVVDEPFGDLDLDVGEHIEDDQLRLIFVACHPVLPVAARVALTLRLVAGLTTAEIARAHVVPEATIAQRIVRAKKAIAKAQVPFEVPTGEDRVARLDAVLEVVYLVYNEGYSATAGDDWLRPELCAEALRLGRLLVALCPAEPEIHGLVALMEIQSSRLVARTGPSGEPILLLDQDRRRWDRLHVNRGLAALARADELAERPGPYALQASIAACHARAFRAEETDWARVAELYEALAAVTPSPVVELNRAVAVAMAFGPAAGLDLVDQLVATGTLDRYHLLGSVRGDLLEKLGRHGEAADEFQRAASLAQNRRERQLSLDRAAACRAAQRTAPRRGRMQP